MIMAVLTLKNLSDDVYAELKRLASRNKRSIVAEATILLEEALGKRSISQEDILNRAALLREQATGYMTSEDIKAQIEAGRK